MSTQYSNLEIQVAEVGRSHIMATDYISITEALKLVSPFNGNKIKVLTYTPRLVCVNPENRGRLYQFVLRKISREPRTAMSHRNLENWES
jgi:hypothetical protein